MSDWKAKLSCFTPNYVEHQVGDDMLRFWPVSVGMVFELRRIGKPLAKSLSVLFDRHNSDQGTHDILEKDEHGQDRREMTIMPIAVEMAEMRHRQRSEAIEGLIESITSPENAEVIGKVIMDSLHEVFPKGDKNNPPPAAFIKELPTTALGAMLVGVAKANKDVLGPLTERVTEATEAVVARIGKPQDNSDEPSVEEETPNPTNG